MRLKNKLQTPAPAGKKPKARFSPAKAAYYVFLGFYDVPDGHATVLCLGCMDEGHGNHLCGWQVEWLTAGKE